MRKEKFWMGIAVIWSFVLLGCLQNLNTDEKVPRMTKEELKSMLDHPDVIIVDVRLENEWNKSQWKIKGAVRIDPEKEIQSAIGKYARDKTYIFYCS